MPLFSNQSRLSACDLLNLNLSAVTCRFAFKNQNKTFYYFIIKWFVSWAHQLISNIRQLQYWHTLSFALSFSSLFFYALRLQIPQRDGSHGPTHTDMHTFRACCQTWCVITIIPGAMKPHIHFHAIKGGKKQTKLVREQKQYLNDRYCCAFTQITHWNIKREMKAINAVIGHRTGNSSGIVDLYHLLIILEMTIELPKWDQETKREDD